MAELDYEVKRNGLDFAAKVKLLASEAPDPFAASTLRKSASIMEKHYGFAAHEKKAAICQYLAKSGGVSSIAELIERFGWHIDITTHLVGELEIERRVLFFDAPPAGTGRGRPARRIRLVGP